MPKTPRSPKLRLNVTDEIIAASKPRDSNHCMIADALKASYPDAKAVAVDLATIRFTDRGKGLRYTYLTPRIAQVHLVKFDQGILPDAYSFVLRGAHVTKSGSSRVQRALLKAEGKTKPKNKQRTEAGHRLNEALRKTRIVARNKGFGNVPDRVGGQAPPVQRGKDNVPFSRRRAFGLRALEY